MHPARFVVAAAVCSVLMAGCASHGAAVPPVAQSGVVVPQVIQTGQQPTNWEIFSTNSTQSNVHSPVAGPDGNLWFTICCSGQPGKIAKMDMSGNVTAFTLPSGHIPVQIAIGHDGIIWIAEENDYIGRMTPTGSFTEYLIPIPNELPESMTIGPDRNIWFSESQPGNEQQMIGRMQPNGKFLAPLDFEGGPSMTTGPDGRVWTTQFNSGSLAAITTAGQVTYYDGLAEPAQDIIPGPGGDLWYSQNEHIGKITTTGTVTEYLEPSSIGIAALTVGPDGHIWFSMLFAQYLGRISQSGSTQFIPSPYNNQEAGGIVKGPDNNIWIGEYQNFAVYIRLVLSVSPSSITFGSVGQTQTIAVSETKYFGGWTATSLNSAVATVAPASSNTFTVTAVGSGSTSIQVADSKRNIFDVAVTVP